MLMRSKVPFYGEIMFIITCTFRYYLVIFYIRYWKEVFSTTFDFWSFVSREESDFDGKFSIVPVFIVGYNTELKDFFLVFSHTIPLFFLFNILFTSHVIIIWHFNFNIKITWNWCPNMYIIIAFQGSVVYSREVASQTLRIAVWLALPESQWRAFFYLKNLI